MIMDYNEQFSDGTTAITFASNAGTDSSILDMMTANWNGGAGTPVWVIASVGTTLSGASAETIQVALSASTASGGTYTTIVTGRAYTMLEAIKGAYLLAEPLPAGLNIQRFIKLTYTISAASLTAGVVDAYLSLNAPRF